MEHPRAPGKDRSPLAKPPDVLHPAWRAFIASCARLEHGEIERLSIRNGVPVIAELTKKKVKFTS